MAITNLNNTHLTAAQVTAATAALTALETELAVVNVNLSAEERQRYGSIHVDWAEYTKDFTSRNNLEGMIARLESLIVRLNNAKILHDYDNYQAALADYAYANFMAGTASPGYEIKVNEMKQFFTRATASTTPPTE